MKACDLFVPFPQAYEVCDTCGQLREGHKAPEREYTSYREAIWMTLLKHGGAYSYYGHYDSYHTARIRAHLGMSWKSEGWLGRKVKEGRCKIDWLLTDDPHMDDVPEFTDTFDESDPRTTVISGRLNCVCGELSGEHVILRDKSLGQLIWLTVREGEQ